jgi:hypothetical protein
MLCDPVDPFSGGPGQRAGPVLLEALEAPKLANIF